MSKLNEKLLSAQYELKAPKGQFNSFGKYKYRSSEDILEAVKPINNKFGFTLTLSDKPVLVGDWHYIEATATITDEDEQISVTAYARESQTKKGMDDSQITGTASSYARKYALNGLYLIDDTKDADTDEHKQQANKPESEPKQKVASAAQIKQFKDALHEYATVTGNDDAAGIGKIEAWGLGQVGVENFKDIPETKITPVIATVKARIVKQKSQEQTSLMEGNSIKPKV